LFIIVVEQPHSLLLSGMFSTEEIFFDVLEEVDLNISPLGLVQGSISGVVHLRSKLLASAVCHLHTNIDKPFALESG